MNNILKEIKLKKGDFVNFKYEKLQNPLLRVFYVDNNRIYGEITDKELSTSVGVPMVGGFKNRKKFTGVYISGEREEFEFNIDKNLNSKKIKLSDVFDSALIKALNGTEEDQVEWAKSVILKQIFKR